MPGAIWPQNLADSCGLLVQAPSAHFHPSTTFTKCLRLFLCQKTLLPANLAPSQVSWAISGMVAEEPPCLCPCSQWPRAPSPASPDAEETPSCLTSFSYFSLLADSFPTDFKHIQMFPYLRREKKLLTQPSFSANIQDFVSFKNQIYQAVRQKQWMWFCVWILDMLCDLGDVVSLLCALVTSQKSWANGSTSLIRFG